MWGLRVLCQKKGVRTVNKLTNLIILASLFVGLHILAPIVSNKIILLYGISFTAGAMLIGFSYAVLDIINDWQGKAEARATVKAALIVRLSIFLVFIPLIIILPAKKIAPGFDDFLVQSVRLFGAGLVSLWASAYVVSTTLFTALKARMNGRMFVLRYLIISFPVILTASVVYVTLGFWGTDTDLPSLYTGQTIARILLSVAVAPVVWAVRRMVAIGNAQ